MLRKHHGFAIATLSVIATLNGCATLSPEASNVMVYNQQTTLLDTCKRLGPVSATASAWSKWDMQQTAEQARSDLRKEAFERYGADSVAIINIDKHLTSVTAQGIAFKCRGQ